MEFRGQKLAKIMSPELSNEMTILTYWETGNSTQFNNPVFLLSNQTDFFSVTGWPLLYIHCQRTLR